MPESEEMLRPWANNEQGEEESEEILTEKEIAMATAISEKGGSPAEEVKRLLRQQKRERLAKEQEQKKE